MRTDAAALAINGGDPVKTTPYGTGRRFGEAELAELRQALDQQTLFYGHGNRVKRACEMMAAYTGRPHVVACSSGSAAIHLGLIAAGIGPGDEVVVTPNTDSGSVIGIIEEGAVPVFCDCEETLQASARTVAAALTDRTKAVEVIHLAGSPAPVAEIIALCEPRGIAVVEDCAQSWGARIGDRLVGSFGIAGCYSVNDYKHISAGDGGFVALSDEALYRRVSNYADKHYDRLFDRELVQRHHGMNYRMSELQGAVTCAQLDKIDAITSRHHELGERLRQGIAGVAGARLSDLIEGAYCSYWFSVMIIEPEALLADRDQLLAALQAEGISAGSYGRYDLIQTGLFRERIVRPWLTGDRGKYPFVQPDGRSYTYSHESTPTHQRLLQTGIMLSVGVNWTDQDMDETVAAIVKVFGAYAA